MDHWCYRDTVTILESVNPSYTELHLKQILEDTESPITKKIQSKLYQGIIDRKHIDFDDIPNSKGNFSRYNGYASIMQTLDALHSFANEESNKELIQHCDDVLRVIDMIQSYDDLYEKGFGLERDTIILEYNLFVYTIIQATSSLLYTYIDFVKNPSQKNYTIQLKNSKTRADLFYMDQIKKMRMILGKSTQYREYLTGLLGVKNNFIGSSTMIGIATVSAIAFSIVPVCRELIYQYYSLSSRVSDYLEQQAAFLEMNRSRLEANAVIDPEKKGKIIEKQTKIANQFRKLSDKLKVSNARSSHTRESMIKKDNKLMRIDRLRDEIESSPIELI